MNGKGFIWWLRSAFCKHEWRERGKTVVHWLNDDGTRMSEIPQYNLCTKECTKCGWIWRQKL